MLVSEAQDTSAGGVILQQETSSISGHGGSATLPSLYLVPKALLLLLRAKVAEMSLLAKTL
jgi:hypothetical protein